MPETSATKKSKLVNYNRVEQAIHYILQNHDQQPNLKKIADHLHLSEFHFQRLFHNWAGTTPKQFLQFITLQHAQELLNKQSILYTTYSLGLSSPSRLHELFIKIEGMSPAQYRQGGKGLTIEYSYFESIFGLFIIASTTKGICLLSFCENEEQGYLDLSNKFPQSFLMKNQAESHQQVMDFFANPHFNKKLNPSDNIKLHLKGTPFQLKVWQSLLSIPLAELTSYGSIAQSIDKPKAQRAVGTAIGQNPIAFLIPCHRVIQKSGMFGNYRWGEARKASLIGWESSQEYCKK